MIRILVLTLLMVSVAFAQEDTGARKAPSTAEEVDILFGEFWNAGDLEGIVSLYEPDAILIGPDGQPAKGTDAIRETIKLFGIGSSKIEMNVISTTPASDEIVLLFNHWTVTAQNEDGSPLEVSGRAIEMVRRQPDGTWRFLLDHPSAGDVGWTSPSESAE